MKTVKFLDRQTGRKEQRMRNILVVLAMFICTSICLGWKQEITISGDIGVRAETMKLEHYARIDAMKKKEAELKAEWVKREQEARASLEKLRAQRQRDKLELERAAERVAQRAERAKERMAAYDKYDEMKYTDLWEPLWRNKEPQAKKERDEKFAQAKKERDEKRAQWKELGKLTARLWRDKPLSELDKLLVDREKQLRYREKQLSEKTRSRPASWMPWMHDVREKILAERKEKAELEAEWEKLYAGLEELDKRLAEERAKRAARMKEEEELWLEEWEKERKEELKKLALLDMEQTMKDGKHMEQCLESLKRAGAGEAVYPDIAGNGTPNSDPDKYKHGKALTDGDDNAIWKDPNNNSLTIKPGVKVGDVFGAKMNKASVDKNKDNKAFLSMTNNEVIVSGGEFGCGNTNGDIAGAWADDDIADLMNISSNTVRITGGSKIGNVYGGRTKYGTVSSSTVRITGGSNIRDVFGGRAYNGTVSSNTVRIEGGTVRNVFGGYVFEGTVSSNTVIITGGSKIGDVFGGYVFDGTVSSNTVIITGGSEIGNVYGGSAYKGTVSSNTVRIEGGTVQNVYGGRIMKGNGTATGNTVEITNTTVGRDVYGARILRDIASSNTVTITSGKVEGSVFGGYIEEDGTATGNKVTLINMGVVGDINENNVYGAKIGSGVASNNTVTITDGMVLRIVLLSEMVIMFMADILLMMEKLPEIQLQLTMVR